MEGRVFITGDKHRTLVPLFGLAENIELFDTDILIIAGDAGYVWDNEYYHVVQSLQKIFPGTIAFIDGNHENHEILNNMDISIWNGGRVHKVGERVIHLMRGEIYSIYGKNYFTFGGASSVDKDRREEGVSWWKEEQPTNEEMDYGRENLLKHKDNIDYVITHETPLFARAHISRQKHIEDGYLLPQVFDQWYYIMSNSLSFKKWYFGHMHVDQVITPNLQGIYQSIMEVGQDKSIRWG